MAVLLLIGKSADFPTFLSHLRERLGEGKSYVLIYLETIFCHPHAA